MAERVQIITDGRDVGAMRTLRGVRNELTGVNRDAGRASGSFTDLYARANPGTQTLSGLRAVRNVLLGVAAAGAAAGAALVPAFSREKSEAQFAQLLKSATKAKKLLEDMEQTAAKTPLQMGSLENVARRLLAAGVALERMPTLFQRLGDAASGDAEKLDRLTNAYAKVSIKGKASMEELNLFIEAGVPIIGALADHFGVAESAIFSMSQRGELSFGAIDQALANLTTGSGLLAGQMAAMAETASGKWSTLKDNVVMAAQQIGRGMLPPIKAAIDEILADIQRLRASGDLEKWGEAAADAIEDVYKALRKLGQYLGRNGKKLLVLGGGYMAGRGLLGLGGNILQVAMNLRMMKVANRMAQTGIAGTGMAAGQAAATTATWNNALAELQMATPGITNATNVLAASEGHAAMKAAALAQNLNMIGTTGVAAAAVYLAKQWWNVADAIDEANKRLKEIEDRGANVSGTYAQTAGGKRFDALPQNAGQDLGYLFGVRSLGEIVKTGFPNLGNALVSLFTGDPMAIAGDGGIETTASPITDADRAGRKGGQGKPKPKPEPLFDQEKLKKEQETVRKWVRELYWKAMQEIASGKENGENTLMFRAIVGDEDKFLQDTEAGYAKVFKAAKRAIPGKIVSPEVGLEVLGNKLKSAIQEEEERTKRRNEAVRKGWEAQKQLAKLRLQWMRQDAERYVQARAAAARKKERADREAAAKAKRTAEKLKKRAAGQWSDLVNKTPAQRRKERRAEEREERRVARKRRSLLRKAMWKIHRGQTDRLTDTDKEVLRARHNEIMAERAGRRGRRKAASADRAARAAEARDKQLKRMRWVWERNDRGGMAWRLRRNVKGGRAALNGEDPAQRRLLASPPVIKMFSDISTIAQFFANQGRH